MTSDKLPQDLAGLEEVLIDHLEAIVQLGRDTHQIIQAVRNIRDDDRPAAVLRIIPDQVSIDDLLTERHPPA